MQQTLFDASQAQAVAGRRVVRHKRLDDFRRQCAQLVGQHVRLQLIQKRGAVAALLKGRQKRGQQVVRAMQLDARAGHHFGERHHARRIASSRRHVERSKLGFSIAMQQRGSHL